MRFWRASFMVVLPLFMVPGSEGAPAPGDGGRPTVHRPHALQPGVVVFAGRDGKAYGVANDGTIVRTWADPHGRPIGYARPLDDGTLLVRLDTPERDRAWIAVLDSASEIQLEISEPEGVRFHHDHSRLPNGNYLVLCHRTLLRPEVSAQEIQDDCVIELNAHGDVVWSWQTADHFEEFEFSSLTRERIDEHGGDWAHANAATAIPPGAGHTDPRFEAGNVILSYRSLDAIVIVDRDTGNIVWKSIGVTIGQHDAHVLGDDVPGTGNVLVFDNGIGGEYGDRESAPRYYSRVLEIDPVTDAVVWEYDATLSGRPSWTFFSWFVSGAERQPNGNTLITDGAFGTIFEVTPRGEVVWEYTNPTQSGTVFGPELSNHVYRAHKVPMEWPGL